MHITRTNEAVEWVAAALYANQVSNQDHLLPKYDELPDRLKNKFRVLATDWLEAIVPLLKILDR